MKLPIQLCDEGDNGPGLVMSAFIATAANAIVYAGYRMLKGRKTKQRDREHKVAFAKYQSKTDAVNEYIKTNLIFYQSSLNTEGRNLGLVVIEAYYGLADHIYQVEAGLLIFAVPETA